MKKNKGKESSGSKSFYIPTIDDTCYRGKWLNILYENEIIGVAQSPDEFPRGGQIIVRESCSGNDSKNIRPWLDDRLEQLKFTESTWRTRCRQSRNPGYGISHARGHRGNYA